MTDSKIDPAPTDADLDAAGIPVSPCLQNVYATAAASDARSILDEAEARVCRRWERTKRNPFPAARVLAAGRFGVTPEQVVLPFSCDQPGYARVMTSPADPRLFVLAPEDGREGRPAVLLALGEDDVVGGPANLLALDLTAGSPRFWRHNRGAGVVGDVDAAVDARGTLRLRQDAHGWARAHFLAAWAYQSGWREGRDAHDAVMGRARNRTGLDRVVQARQLPADEARRVDYLDSFRAANKARDKVQQRWSLAARKPDGMLILEPDAFDWTRKGVLRGVEAIEILDAPAGGALGRALVRMNPRIGGPRGVPLYGAEPAKVGGRRPA